ncbi:hypothetical protein CLPU_16c00180 [Gottschalkia purinilytica]|uniref:Uncharacterized protein n=1 Tax=Gottschalkia purinilytica TaxID=1503 RepID=A0A0L0W877_GOTPU|nr:hypothetical protein CLPU_16c00180 [Gottschalkia purinilytica]
MLKITKKVIIITIMKTFYDKYSDIVMKDKIERYNPNCRDFKERGLT